MAKIKIKSHRLSDNIISHYKCNDDNDNTTVIDSAGANNGTSARNTDIISIPGKINKALYFQTATDYVNLGKPANLNTNITDFSLCCWTKLDATLGLASTNYHIFSNESYQHFGYQFRIEDTTSELWGKLSLRTNIEGVATYVNAQAQSYPNDNEWHYVVVTKNGTVGSVYIDGEEVGGYAVRHSLNNPTDSTLDSIFGYPGSQPLRGAMDDFRIYNRSLTLTEIKALYNNGRGTLSANPSYPSKAKANSKTTDLSANELVHYKMNDNTSIPTPVAHYKMNDNAANTTVINDNGTNGTLKGGDTTATKSIVGKINGALGFNGVDDYVNTNQTFSTLFSGAFSISFWAKPDEGHPTETKPIYGVRNWSGANQYNLSGSVYSDGDFIQYFATGTPGNVSCQISNCFPAGACEWTHIVMTCDGGGATMRVRAYKNGVYNKVSAAYNQTTFVNSFNLYIGGWDDPETGYPPPRFHAGGIDDFRIYDFQLDLTQVEAIYNEGLGTEATGTTVVNSANQLINGTLGGGNATADISVAGKIDKALDFNGTSDYVDCGNDTAFDIGTVFSSSAWIKTSSTGTWKWVIGLGEHAVSKDRSLVVNNSNQAALFCYDDNPTSTTIVTDGEWHHIVATCDGTNAKIYVDGILEDTTQPTLVAYSFIGATIGVRELPAEAFTWYEFNGSIDDARIFDKALSANEVKGIFAKGRGTESESVNVSNITI